MPRPQVGAFVRIAQSMSLYEEYKPFRNYIRHFDLLSSLVDVWRYSLHVMEGEPLPADYASGKNALTAPVKEYLYPWDLDILAKEIILNAGSAGGDRSLKRWKDIATAINYVRRLDDAAFARNGGAQVDVMFELSPDSASTIPVADEYGCRPVDARVQGVR
jgi:hypothetical protein